MKEKSKVFHFPLGEIVLKGHRARRIPIKITHRT